MDLVVDEAVRCIHFAACLTVRALERVFALERGAAVEDSSGPVPAVWHRRPAETSEPSELSRVDLARYVGAHVDGWVIGPSNKVLSEGQGFCCDGDLDKPIDSLGGDLSRAKPRVYGCHLAGSLILDAIVQQAGDVPVASESISCQPCLYI